MFELNLSFENTQEWEESLDKKEADGKLKFPVTFHDTIPKIEEIEDHLPAAYQLLDRTDALWTSIFARHGELQSLTTPKHREKLIMPLLELHWAFTMAYAKYVGSSPNREKH